MGKKEGKRNRGKSKRRLPENMKCQNCGKDACHILGKIIEGKYKEVCNHCGGLSKTFKVDAYNLKWKMFKDYQRDKHAGDLLQPIDEHGKPNTDFYQRYPNAITKGEK